MRRERSALVNFLTLTCVAITACTTGSSIPPDTVAHDDRPRLDPTLPITLELKPYRLHIRTVTVTVGGAERTFIFDTAAGVTIITPEVAEAIGCEPFGRVTALRMSGERIDIPRCAGVDLRAGPLAIEHDNVFVIDLAAFLPPDWPRLGGALSLRSFEERALTLDLAGGTLTVESPESLTERTATMRELPIRFGMQAAGAGLDVFVLVESPRGPLWFELDSGAGEVIVARQTADLLDIDLTDPAVEHAPAGDGGADVWSVPEATIRLPGLGALRLPVTVTDIIYDGVLGCRFIEDHILTLDLRTARMWAGPGGREQGDPP